MRFSFQLGISFVILTCTLATPAHAQAPIERRPAPPQQLPPTPQPIAPDPQWTRLIQQTNRGWHDEIRVQAFGEPIHCTIDQLTDTTLFCTEYRVMHSAISDAFDPPQLLAIPRRDIREIRDGGRDLSTLTGVAVGMGIGAGLGSLTPQSRADGKQFWDAALLGVIGGFIGHLAPFKGHLIYRPTPANPIP